MRNNYLKSLLEEIEIYKMNIRLSQKTIKVYERYINKFVDYLSNETNEKKDNIDLQKIFL